MLDLSYYESLPDFMDSKDVKREFEILIKTGTEGGADILLESLYELTLRQVDSNSPIDKAVSTQINDMVISLWNQDSVGNTETCMGIIINLELYDAYIYFRDKLTTIRNSHVKAELSESFTELGNWGK